MWYKSSNGYSRYDMYEGNKLATMGKDPNIPDGDDYKPSDHDPVLILDFKKYYSEPPRKKGMTPFKSSLLDQYERLNIIGNKKKTLLEHLKYTIYSTKNLDNISTVYISQPSFRKDAPALLKNESSVVDNVAIRMRFSKSQDFVMVGDININHLKTGIIGRKFTVKSITMMDAMNKHFGEIELETKIITYYSRNGEHAFLSTNGTEYLKYPSDAIVSNSVLDDGLINELSTKFIVPNPSQVIDRLNEWKEFLETKLSNAENISEGFMINKPEFIVCYSGPISDNLDSRQIIDDNGNKAWTRESGLPGFKPALIARIRHEIRLKEFNQRKDYCRDFNTLTANGVSVIDPTKKMLEDASNKEKNDDKNPLRRLGDNRIHVARIYDKYPKSKIEELRNILERNVKSEEAAIYELTQKKVDSALKEYSESDELLNTVDLEIQESPEDTNKLLDDEINNRIDEIFDDRSEKLLQLCQDLERINDRSSQDYEKIKTEHDELKNRCNRKAIHEEIDIEDAKKSVLEDQRAAITKNCLTKKRSEIWDRIFNEVKAESEAKIEQITAETNSKIKQIEEQEGTKILTVCFDIDVAPEDVKTEADARNAKFDKENSFKLVYDNAGETTVLKRQLRALEFFGSGELTNPYLATAMFAPSVNGHVVPPELNYYYATNLNELQKEAVRNAINSNGVYLIQGPPGTGKTQVISEITAQEVMKGKKVLITSQNNKAVDNAFGRLYKSPIIRPVRIISDKKENKFDLNHILSNFYENVCESLQTQIKITTDENYRNILSDRIDKVEDDIFRLDDIKKSLSDIIKKIDASESNLIKLQNELDLETDLAIQKETEKSNLILKKSGLKTFERDSLGTHVTEIYKLFNPHNVRLIDEKKVFGKNGYADKLAIMGKQAILENLKFTNKYSDCAVMLSQYLTANNEGKARLQPWLDKLLQDNNIKSDDFVLVNIFGNKIPSNLPEIYDSLRKIRVQAEDDLNARIAELEYESEDEDSLTQYRIGILKEKLDSLRSDPDYIDYKDMEYRINKNIQDIFSSLHLTRTFNNEVEALSILRDELDRINNYEKNDLDSSVETYRDIIAYLEEDDIQEVDNERLTREIVDYSNVFGMTCTSNGLTERQAANGNDEDAISIDISTMGVDVVIIDEVSKVPFSELLQPMLSGKTVIMVGDHNQLPPVYTENISDSPNATAEDIEKEKRYHIMYTEPLFEDLFNNTPEYNKIMLKTQYRMARQIMYADNIFYDGELDMGCNDEDKRHYLNINGNKGKLIDESNSIIFIDCNGKEFQESGSTSWTNKLEARVAAQLTRLIEHNCVKNADGEPLATGLPSHRLSAGIITPYAAQSKMIRSMFNEEFTAFRTDDEEKFMVKSVDDFQGDERDIIILSLVRTSERSRFIKDFRRINVAMSRARRLLVIIGKASVLENMEVELTRSDGSKYVSHAYADIIKAIKNTDGYHTSDEIIGCDVNE